MNNLNLHSKNLSGANEFSPLNLAYLGDAVFELLVRVRIMSHTSVNQLHNQAAGYSKAVAQSQMYHKIIDHLNEDELRVLKSGRNAKSHSSAKNASMAQYRHATGLEALFGYLYINGHTERINELFNICMEGEPHE